MIVENGSVTMDLDLNRLNGTGAMTGKLETVRFAVAANSFFSILVFNDLLRGPEQGSMALIPQNSTTLPAALSAAFNQLTVEKLPSTQPFDLAVRDAKTGLTFFNIQGDQYGYDANAQLLSLNGGRLVISREFANALGRPSDAGSEAGKISIGAAMQPIEITQLVDRAPISVVMPPLRSAAGAQAPAQAQGPTPLLGTSRAWNSSMLPLEPRSASQREQTLVTTATSQSIGLHCLIPITRSFRKISIA